MPTFPLCIRNGELMLERDAQMSLQNIEFLYGFGVYENIRAVDGLPRFVDDHIDRLFHSSEIIALDHPFSKEDIATWVHAIIKESKADALNIKILLLGGKTAEEAQCYIFPLAPKFLDKKLYRDGVRTITVSYERPFPEAKTLGMIGSYIAYKKAQNVGAYDALLLNHRGCLTEGTRTNLFFLNGKTIISAPKAEILLGVTMKHVLKIALEHGFTVEERTTSPVDLSSFDSAFLTSTSSKIVPICSIDDHSFSIDDALRELMQAFDASLA
jgi:branched-chain amino acid aminotransferase